MHWLDGNIYCFLYWIVHPHLLLFLRGFHRRLMIHKLISLWRTMSSLRRSILDLRCPILPLANIVMFWLHGRCLLQLIAYTSQLIILFLLVWRGKWILFFYLWLGAEGNRWDKLGWRRGYLSEIRLRTEMKPSFFLQWFLGKKIFRMILSRILHLFGFLNGWLRSLLFLLRFHHLIEYIFLFGWGWGLTSFLRFYFLLGLGWGCIVVVDFGWGFLIIAGVVDEVVGTVDGADKHGSLFVSFHRVLEKKLKILNKYYGE